MIAFLLIVGYCIGFIATIVVMKCNKKWGFMAESDAVIAVIWPVSLAILVVYLVYKVLETVAFTIVEKICPNQGEK